MKKDQYAHLKYQYAHLKFRLPLIKSLAMLKMEKNFIALVEKNYPRQPYDDKNQSIGFLIDRIGDELQELRDCMGFGTTSGMMEECADISNLVDYLFEKLSRLRGGVTPQTEAKR